MIWLAKFKKPADDDAIADVLVAADDGDGALEALRRNGIDDEVARLVEVPANVFCAEVRWKDEDEDEEEDDDAGVVLEVSEALADFLELDANASSVIDVAGER